MMNREYAFNRDKGKCKICSNELDVDSVHCHHINPKLPINEVNKVKNLASVCKGCHKLIHTKNLSTTVLAMFLKLEKYRKTVERIQ